LSIKDEIISLRHNIHKWPEIAFEEYRTQEKIIEVLEKHGVEHKIAAKTGVIATINGDAPTNAVAIRADIDALSVKEETELSFKSERSDYMHACGHDGHVAMLLVAAKILSKYKEHINGTVKFIFQPNEEEAGALDMINEGILDEPKVDAAFGVHLWSPIESGKIGLSAGPV
ncbi:hypothetical protein DU75_11550, partial [Methanosarcina mazei]